MPPLSLGAHHYPGWLGSPAGFGEGQGTKPSKMRGHREEIKKKNKKKNPKPDQRSVSTLLWGLTLAEDWQENEIASVKVKALRTFSSWKLKSILLPFQSGSCYLVGSEEERTLRVSPGSSQESQQGHRPGDGARKDAHLFFTTGSSLTVAQSYRHGGALYSYKFLIL